MPQHKQRQAASGRTLGRNGFDELLRPPVIGYLLIVTEPSDAGDQRTITVLFRPCDRLSLIDRGGEDVVGVVLNNIILDTATTFGGASI
jgi:hypothetical protein